MRVVFISDLDGTLLGQNDFRFDKIKDNILYFLSKGIVLIPASSKTQSEIEDFCASLGARLPFICENGGAFVNADLLHAEQPTENSTRTLGQCTHHLLTTFSDTISPHLQAMCRFLHAMDSTAQSNILGLEGDTLTKAMDRKFSVLFAFDGSPSDFASLQQQASSAQLMIQCGGRVCSISAPHDKASFHGLIKDLLGDDKVTIVGFGDAQNDVSMLQSSDIACIIPRPDCAPLSLPEPPATLIHASLAAPMGWLETAEKALNIIEKRFGK